MESCVKTIYDVAKSEAYFPSEKKVSEIGSLFLTHINISSSEWSAYMRWVNATASYKSWIICKYIFTGRTSFLSTYLSVI